MNNPTDTNQASEDELDTILTQHREWMRGIRTDRLIGTSHAETKTAILQWVADKIIGEEEIVRLEADHDSSAAKKKSNRNWLRYEQREKLKAEGWKDE